MPSWVVRARRSNRRVGMSAVAVALLASLSPALPAQALDVPPQVPELPLPVPGGVGDVLDDQPLLPRPDYEIGDLPDIIRPDWRTELPAGFDPRFSRRLDDLTTDDFERYANADGTITDIVSTGPTRFRAPGGRWHPIDLTPVGLTDGTLRARSVETAAGIRLDGGTPVQTLPSDLGPIEVQEHSLSSSLATAAAAQIDPEELVATLPALGGQVLRYRFLPDGVKEDVVIATPLQGSHEVTFTLPEGVATRQGDGAVEFVDGSGNVVGVYEGGTAYDLVAALADKAPEGTYTPVTVTLTSPTTAVVGVDQTWLSSPTRAFPVTLDPTLRRTFAPGRDDLYLNSDNPDSTTSLEGPETGKAYVRQDHLRLGRKVSTLGTGTVALFPVAGLPTDPPSGYTYTSSSLRLWGYSGSPTPCANNVQVRVIEEAWNPPAMTWNGYFNDPSDGSDPYLDVSAVTDGDQPLNVNYHVLKAIDTTNALARRFAHDPWYGLHLQATNNTDSCAWREYRSTDFGQNVPQLLITYTASTPQTPPPPPGSASNNRGNQRPSQRQGGDPVDIVTGNLVDSTRDLNTPSDIFGLDWERTYNSLDPTVGDLGRGWTNSFDMAIEEHDGVADLLMPDGRVATFAYDDEAAVWRRPPELPADLTEVSGNFRVTFNDGTRWDFDPLGQLASMTDALGDAVTINRDTAGQLQSAVSSQGMQLEFTYGTSGNAAGKLVSVEGPGGTATYTYDGRGNLASGEGEQGPRTYEYDTSDRLTEVHDGSGATLIANTFDSQDRVATQTYASGATSAFTYDGYDPDLDMWTTELTDSVTGPSGKVTYTYDSALRVRGITDALPRPGGGTGNVTAFDYDTELWDTTSVISRLGGQTLTAYDDANRVTCVAQPGGDCPDTLGDLTSGTGPYSAFKYDSQGRVLDEYVAGHGTTTNTYSGTYRHPVKVTDPAGGETNYVLVDGWISVETDADGVKATYTRDAAKRVTSVKDGAGITTTYVYDDAGRLMCTASPRSQCPDTDGLGGYHTYHWRSYDDAGRVVQEYGPDGSSTAHTWLPDGREASVTDASGATTTNTYDPDTQLLTAVSRPGKYVGSVLQYNTWTYAYDDDGNRVCEASPGATCPDANGDGGVQPYTTYEYGPLGRLLSMTNELGQVTTYGYDADGHQTEVHEPNGAVSTKAYDAAGREVESVDPLGRTTRTYYDDLGRVTCVAEPTGDCIGRSGPITTTTYDALGRVATVTDTAGGTTTYQYTAAGRQSAVIDAAGAVRSTVYDDGGRPWKSVDPNGGTTVTLYDDQGWVQSVTSPMGLTTSYKYFYSGLVNVVEQPSGTRRWFDYTNRGELETEVFDDGSGTYSVGNGGTRYLYNGDGTVRSVTSPAGGVTTYDYDARGNRTTRTNAQGKVETWEYDDADQILSYVDQLNRETSFTYWNDPTNGRKEQSVDASGRSATTRFRADGAIAAQVVTGAPQRNYWYDDSTGRLASIESGSSEWSFGYDQTGRLVRYTSDTGRVTRWSWDAAGRRTDTIAPDGTTWHYAYDAAGRLRAVSTPNASELSAEMTNSFESGNDNGHGAWTASPAPVVTTDQARTGSRALHLPPPTSGWTSQATLSLDDLDLVPGKSYTVSAWFTGTDQTVTGSVTFDGSSPNLAWIPASQARVTTLGTWVQSMATFTVPAGATHAYVQWGLFNSHHTDGRLYIDDFAATETPLPATGTPVVSGTFESGTDSFGAAFHGAPVRTTARAHTGTGSLQIDGDARRTLSLTPNAVYTLSAWFSGAGCTIVGGIEFLQPGPVKTTVNIDWPACPSSGWVKSTATFRVPTDATSASIYLQENNYSPATWYLDDVRIDPGLGATPPAPAYRSGTSATTYGTGSLTTNAPAGATTGDVLIGTVISRAPSATVPALYSTDFESGIDGWSKYYAGTPALSTTVAHSGTTSVKMPGTSSNPSLYREITVTEGTAYKFASWIRGSAAGGAYPYTSFRFLNASGALLDTQSKSSTWTSQSEWTQMNHTATAPPGSTRMQVIMWTTASTEWYVDDISVTPLTGPRTTPPSGWKLAMDTAVPGSTRTQVWWKPVAAGEPSTYTWTTPAGMFAHVTVAAFSGVDPRAPFDGMTTRTNASSTSYRLDGLQLSASSRSLVAIVAAPSGTSPNVPPGMTALPSVAGAMGMTGLSYRMATEEVLFAGGTGTKTGSSSAATATDATMLALRPAAALVGAYTYDADGRLTQETLADGSRSYGYGTSGFNRGHLTSFAQTLPGANRSTTLTWNGMGVLASESTGGVTTTYGYDRGRQLKSATPSTGAATTWTYDQLGRRATEVAGGVTRTYRYDDANQLCWTAVGTSTNGCTAPPAGATTYAYDDAGRRTAETVSATDKVTYAYDPLGHLSTLTRVAGATSTTQTRTYDGLDNLTGFTNTGGDTSTAAFDWDIAMPVPQLVDQVLDGITTDLVYGANRWGAQYQGGTLASIATDVHGSVIPTSSTAGLAQSSAYDAWGAPSSATDLDPALGYRGELAVDDLVGLRNRQYDPQTGTFTTVDPLDGVDGTTTLGQRYAYGDNSPLMRIDPLGTQARDRDVTGAVAPSYLQNGYRGELISKLRTTLNLCSAHWAADSGCWNGENLYKRPRNASEWTFNTASTILHQFIDVGILTDLSRHQCCVSMLDAGPLLRQLGANQFSFDAYGTSKDFTVVIRAWNETVSEQLGRTFSFIGNVASVIALVGFVGCVAGGIGCAIGGAAEAVSLSADAGVLAASCTPGNGAQGCALAAGKVALDAAMSGAAAALKGTEVLEYVDALGHTGGGFYDIGSTLITNFTTPARKKLTYASIRFVEA